MPIRVQHNPDIELLGQTAYQTGQGQAAIREQERRDRLMREWVAFQEKQQARGDQYQFRAEDFMDRERTRQFQYGDRAASREQQGSQFEAEQQRLSNQGAQQSELALLGLGQSQQRIDTERSYRDQQQQYYLD